MGTVTTTWRPLTPEEGDHSKIKPSWLVDHRDLQSGPSTSRTTTARSSRRCTEHMGHNATIYRFGIQAAYSVEDAVRKAGGYLHQENQRVVIQ